MIDPFGRKITYLRVSVTDRCDFRCAYCMSPDISFLPRRELLTLEEIDRLCSAFIGRGVRKLRITGGEPLMRRNIMSLLSSLRRHLQSGALDEITLTTNASQLSKYAAGLFQCGIRRINVSLDTLDQHKFQEITSRGDLTKVLDGIMAAKDAGLKIKINTVAMKGVNDAEAPAMAAWCGEHGFDISFIEAMPIGDLASGQADRYIPLTEIRARLEQDWTLKDIDAALHFGGPSRYAQVAGTGQRIGFITPLSRHFCETCNRVRLTCAGTLYLCLGKDAAVDLRGPLRASESDVALLAAIDKAIALKPKGHDFTANSNAARQTSARNMNLTGG